MTIPENVWKYSVRWWQKDGTILKAYKIRAFQKGQFKPAVKWDSSAVMVCDCCWFQIYTTLHHKSLRNINSADRKG